MKSKKIKINHYKSNKNNKIKYINHFSKKIIIKNNINLNHYSNTFLSSCFKYFYGNVSISNNITNINLTITESFINIKKSGALIIIDYANIIHILFEKYHNQNDFIIHFYNFIYNELHKGSKFYIITKKVIINNIYFDIETVFNTGFKLTKNIIQKHFFENEHINIYNLSYHIKISSSIDDLLSYFICFTIFAYLLNSNIDPNNIQKNNLSKLTILTNDRQFFDKNLFGFTKDELKHHISIKNDLQFKQLKIIDNQYKLINDPLNELLITDFYSSYIKTRFDDTNNLECKLSLLVELLIKNKRSITDLHGYFKKTNLNPNFSKKNFTMKKKPNFSYNNLNKLQKKHLKKNITHKCKNINSIREYNHDLKYYYYLYAFIKYIQMYLFNTNENTTEYGDFFGSFTKEHILIIFS